MASNGPKLLPAAQLDALFDALQRRGYAVVGPRLRDGAIVYDELKSMADLPIGWHDRQGPGRYRVEAGGDRALFGYTVGPQSWKKYLFPPHETLWRGQRGENGFAIEPPPPPPRRAFIGVRACELQAIAVQDRVFTGGAAVDSRYAARRKEIFTVAVNCGVAGATCFCVSMNSGPRASRGFDLALTELLDAQRHDLLVEAGSDAGAEVLAELDAPSAAQADHSQADALVAATAASMGRQLDTTEIRALLYGNAESPRWKAVAERCVSCGNCTSVCPTCFCSDVQDVTSLDGSTTERERTWASCFTQSFTHMAGGSARVSTSSRYRHWLTHKLAGWIDQFGTSGCVGCGRCITWCPPGIDLTEEIAALRADAEKP
ncbi:MAG: 4Fe-4S dicluster domain-containing protein [Nevskia sp.]|nr:4Fe-4S dicluster domain-containing protein [Nevskia sp.]